MKNSFNSTVTSDKPYQIQQLIVSPRFPTINTSIMQTVSTKQMFLTSTLKVMSPILTLTSLIFYLCRSAEVSREFRQHCFSELSDTENFLCVYICFF